MNSCDTFALSAPVFGSNTLCKNSDRPLGEAQPLRYYPRRSYAPGECLQCTHLTIPQVPEAWAVLGCQPYWIWGFEMGVNEWGLAIGNEAQGSRCEPEAEEGLLGMDLLRLGLERAKNAREAVDVITALLETYGQNANASMLFDRRYENSFLLVDPKEIWVLETAGRQWVAKQVEDRWGISNCYSIGKKFDLCSRELEQYARSRRWLAPDEPLDFAKAYTAPAGRQATSTPRWRRLTQLLNAKAQLCEADCKAILRDHFEGALIEPRFGATYGMFTTICMHATTWDVAQTTCSLLTWWEEGLGVVGRYAPSLPCCSVYLPVYLGLELPQCLTAGGETFDPHSLWWQTERLAMAVSIDEARFGASVRQALRSLEEKFTQATREAEAKAKAQPQQTACLCALMESCAAEAMETVKMLADGICRQVEALGGLYGPRKEFLESYCARTQLPL